MVITKHIVTEQLLNYLNHRLSLAALVDWAEHTFIDDILEPPEDVDLLNDILAYLAAADTPQFPLTWELCAAFLEKLGMAVQVIATEKTS